MAVTPGPSSKKPTTPVPLLLPGVGERFGPYVLLAEVARGGMGVVYRAQQSNPDRVVALKMILPFRLNAPEIVRRFRVEAEAVARLEHPNILPIYEAGERDGIPYFSMRLTQGGNLGEALPRFAGKPREAVELVVTIARATQHAHDRGILHRDLKPANILIDEDGTPYIADFGLAKVLEPAGDVGITQSNAVLGTPHYAAPEQASGKGGPLTPAVDVYSLGAILYEMLGGRPPFAGTTAFTALRRAAEGSAPPLRSFAPEVPPELEAICDRCLQPDPRLRYASAAAMADDLQRWLNGQSLAPWNPPILPRVLVSIRQNRLLVLAGIALLLVAAGLAVGLRIRNAMPDIDIGGSDNPEAVHFLRRSLDLNPSTNIIDRKHLAETAELLQRAVSADPNYAAAYAELSRVHSQMYWHFHDHSEARAEKAFIAANTALQLKPGYARAHLALAEYWFRCRREDEKALQEIALAREHTPRDPDLYNLFQLVAKRQGHWDEALAAIRKLCELRPTSARDQGYLGDTLQIMHRYPESLVAYDRAIYLAPEAREYVLARAEMFMLWKGDLGPMDQYMNLLPRGGPADDQNFYALYLLDRCGRRYDNLLRLITAQPDDYVYMDKTHYWPKAFMLGLAHQARGEVAAARDCFDQARPVLEAQRDAAPGEARVHSSLGLLYAMIGERAESIREGERAADLMPLKTEPVFGSSIRETLAEIYFRAGQPQAAVAILRDLLERPGDLTVAMLKMDPVWDIARDFPEFQQLLASGK